MLRRCAPFALGLVAACSDEPADVGVRDHHGEGIPPIGVARSALAATDPVSAAVDDDGCTTAILKGLATQLVEEIQCLHPGTFTTIESDPGLDLASAVFPWLQTPARQALLDAQKERGTTMSINSALRTLPQQYLLYRWYKTGRCGISLAAEPGKSNHEAGLAVDVEDNAGWRPIMANHSFFWLGSSDPVHFDYKGDGSVDIGGLSVLAFQKLWNQNHPDDRIDEDSAYGSATEERLSKSPIGGFAIGPDCNGQADASTPPPPSGSDGGSSGALGPSGTRHDSDTGCACSAAPGARSDGPLALVAIAAFALRRARRRRDDAWPFRARRGCEGSRRPRRSAA